MHPSAYDSFERTEQDVEQEYQEWCRKQWAKSYPFGFFDCRLTSEVSG